MAASHSDSVSGDTPATPGQDPHAAEPRLIQTDVVVIGSGFGGAVTALRRAQHGEHVVVVERGRRYRGTDFPRTIGEFRRSFFNAETGEGFLEYLAFKKVDVIAGVGVGGGSLHYFNVNTPTPPEVFERPGWPTGVTRAALDPYYAVVTEMLGSQPIQAPAAESSLPPRTIAFGRAATAAGHAPEHLRIAVWTGETRPHPISGETQHPCNYCGNCLLGCDRGAKNTLDHNYLALAERLGATILEQATATCIRPLSDGGYEVALTRTANAPNGHVDRIRARHVVLAAGAVGSTELLLRCRDELGTLPHLSDQLGTRFSINGEFLLAYADGASDTVDPGVGPPITRMVRASTDDHELSVQDLGLPDQLLWFLEGAAPPTFERLRRVGRLASSWLARTLRADHSSRSSRISLRVDALTSGARSPNAIPFLGMGTDTADGRIRLRRGALRIDWSPWRNRKLYSELQQLMTDISAGAGGRFVTSALWRWPLRKALTAHPLGGCPMGDSASTGVVDHTGEAYGHPGLFVIDGSIIPAALAVNPSLTIAAIAERCAFLRTNDRELQLDDTHGPLTGMEHVA